MNKVKRLKRTISKLGYRTPNIFRRNIKHKIAKRKISDTISPSVSIKDSTPMKNHRKNKAE